jgi:Tuberculosis necrotizing toxin
MRDARGVRPQGAFVTKPRILFSLAASAALVLGGAAAATAATGSGSTAPGASTPLDQCSAAFYDGNSLLGPNRLPVFGVVGAQVIGYQRTGLESPAQFLAEYHNASGWIYPPDNGYVVVGDVPLEWTETLLPGEDIDRYGSVYGSFLAPAGTPYAERAIPPSSLDSTPAAGCNYHDYQVLKPFNVDSGPIAAWFDQPGGGLQFQLDGNLVPGAPAQLNVLWLLDNGYLTDVTPAS